ncbi:hypothetical protein ACFCZ6_14475 [Streptomyces hydrogenans]|uniref:hypothetical protein n=1 Tax=Streptomyces hydrogenans TaxID=1873719 RepID=UPI0035D6D757
MAATKHYQRTENGTVTTVTQADGLAEINHAKMGGRRAVKTMSSITRTDYAITYKDGRDVRLVLVAAPVETPCCEHATMYHGGRGCDLCDCSIPRAALRAHGGIFPAPVKEPVAPVTTEEPVEDVEPELERCEPVMGGKVHTLFAGTLHDGREAPPWPLCRTGASTNRGTRYRKTTAPLSCTACLGYQERREAARAHQ